MQTNPLNVIILSADLVGDLFLKFSFKLKTEREDRTRNDDLRGKSDDAVHNDLKKAFKQLTPHFILVCEQEDYDRHSDLFYSAIDDIESLKLFPGDNHLAIDEADITPEDKPNLLMDCYRVTGFKVDSNGENESVTLTGSRKLKSGDVIDITSQPIKFQKSKYEFLHDLRAAIDTCRDEVSAYLNGKCAPPLQQDLFEGMDAAEEGNTSVEISSGGKTVKLGSVKEFSDLAKRAGRGKKKDKVLKEAV